MIASSRVLPYRKKECVDCAVSWGMYEEIAEALCEETKDVQDRMGVTWFCHETPDRVCRGNLNYRRKKQGPLTNE